MFLKWSPSFFKSITNILECQLLTKKLSDHFKCIIFRRDKIFQFNQFNNAPQQIVVAISNKALISSINDDDALDKKYEEKLRL